MSFPKYDCFKDCEKLLFWARDIMRGRNPDFVIGDDYLRRWHIIPRTPAGNVYLHEINKSDDDRGFHDHPWDFQSFILEGGYLETTPDGDEWYFKGSILRRKATDLHRLVIPEGGRAVSLVITGPIIREWGFEINGDWVSHNKIINPEDPGQRL